MEEIILETARSIASDKLLSDAKAKGFKIEQVKLGARSKKQFAIYGDHLSLIRLCNQNGKTRINLRFQQKEIDDLIAKALPICKIEHCCSAVYSDNRVHEFFDCGSKDNANAIISTLSKYEYEACYDLALTPEGDIKSCINIAHVIVDDWSEFIVPLKDKSGKQVGSIAPGEGNTDESGKKTVAYWCLRFDDFSTLELVHEALKSPGFHSVDAAMKYYDRLVAFVDAVKEQKQ